MPMEELRQIIETVRERAELHRAVLEDSIPRTRMSLVEPVLRALGWDTGDPRQVWPDYTHPMKDGEDGSTRSVNLMLFMETAGTWVAIEVIPLGSEPHPEAPERRLQVCRKTNTPLAVVTNGTSWWFHTNPETAGEKQETSVDLGKQPDHQAALGLMILWAMRGEEEAR